MIHFFPNELVDSEPSLVNIGEEWIGPGASILANSPCAEANTIYALLIGPLANERPKGSFLGPIRFLALPALQHDKVRILNDYAKRKLLPPGLKQALKQHLALEMAVDKVRPNVLNGFPHHLKAKVLRSQHKERVARTYLFSGTSPQFLDQVVRRQSSFACNVQGQRI
jgi:hypothetical protein